MGVVSRSVLFARNLLRDLKHGGFLGGMKKTPHADKGAYDTANSGYGALQEIFADDAVDAIARGRALVDIGCGKGRVLNFLIEKYPRNEIAGVEIDEEVASAVRCRLGRHQNVSILAGDVRNIELPDHALFYMFNPFDAVVMADFANRVALRADRSAIIYYNPLHREIFDENPAFEVKEVNLDSTFHKCLLIMLR